MASERTASISGMGAAALGVFVDKEAHKSFLQTATNMEQKKHIGSLQDTMKELVQYGRGVGEANRGLVARGRYCDEKIDMMEDERVEILEREREQAVVHRAFEFNVS